MSLSNLMIALNFINPVIYRFIVFPSILLSIEFFHLAINSINFNKLISQPFSFYFPLSTQVEMFFVRWLTYNQMKLSIIYIGRLYVSWILKILTNNFHYNSSDFFTFPYTNIINVLHLYSVFISQLSSLNNYLF